MKKLIKQLHIWLSIPLGVVVSITCFTGALLVFEKEITRAVQREYHYVAEVGAEALPLDELQAQVEATLAEGKSIQGVEIDDNPERTYVFSLGKRERIYVNQYTGEILGSPERLEFFQTTFRLHRWLMDAPASRGEMSLGKLVVGISTLAMVVMLLTGIVLWWPKSIKMWRNRSLVAVCKGWHRFWYDLHVSAGFWATIILLIMALTGLVWSFDWYREGFYALFGEGARAWLRSLHVGSIGGMFTRVLWCLAAIVGGTLPLTGYYLWIKRKFFKK